MTWPRKSKLAGLAILSLVIVIATFTLLAALRTRSRTYLEAASRYAHFADGYDSGLGGFIWGSCYGEHWDSYMDSRIHDVQKHKQDRPYRAAQAEYYRRLQRKYERAASRPWVPITLDPPLSKP
jgi:hypothetical protein